MSIDLGTTPESLRVLLSVGYPFLSVLVRSDAAGEPENWPSAPVLTFSDGSTWTAALTTNEAAFSASSSEAERVSELPDLTVVLTVGGVLWARGGVVAR